MSKDLGIKLVREFSIAFETATRSSPEVPSVRQDSRDRIVQYSDSARCLSEILEREAEKSKKRGDEEGSLLLIRLQLIQEELSELAEAFLNTDIVEAFDALVDLSYVVDGTYISLGLDNHKEAGYREVHRSNMSKLDENGRPVMSGAGRVVKGPNYSRPDLRKVLDSPLTEDHPDDQAVDRFAEAMKKKLAKKRAEGRGGWEDKQVCSQKDLSSFLRYHVEKGDPVDVANLAMMLHQRDERILS